MVVNVPCCELMFWVYIIICVVLVMIAGLMSGLTLGLMSLSLVDLEVLVKAGQPRDKKNAAKILPIVKNQHLLLCTLLIGNCLAMEALPIFLDALLPAWGAILISVTLILAFGEIIPQAVCSQYGLRVGAKMAIVVRLLLIVFFPISYPISKLLDWLLGKGHFVLLGRAELKTLVDMHGNEAGKGGQLTHDETTIMTGALDLTQKSAKDAMTPISKTFSLDINSKLDMHTMGLIMRKGHSRVPIYSGSPTNIIGLILVKNLITCRPEDETPIRNVTIRKIPRVLDYMPLYDILNEFQKGHSHMAVVVKCMKDVEATVENAKGGDAQFGQNNRANVATNGSSVHFDITEIRSPTLRNDMQDKDMHLQMKKQEREDENIFNVDVDSLPSDSLDEEFIGIITMEDVMEELLQMWMLLDFLMFKRYLKNVSLTLKEEILDETDDYVELHNKIRINMLSPRRSTARSPGAASVSHLQCRTPLASPLSSYHHTSILRSPVTPYIHAPGPIPTLSVSPINSIPNSPAEVTGPGRSSPSSYRVSRNPYEKLREPGGG
ncbi:hypothetical protein HHK36_026042 [Tetracentron sinense]|uniref:CNNM transmembrane domain-containing protein n=1 Tax=Tetracentron sinense TaxID=13715 RepID=A0A834YMN2_TETSI|nr:hypothetical protein HHK36_026042 [Tetracentron sinense]